MSDNLQEQMNEDKEQLTDIVLQVTLMMMMMMMMMEHQKLTE
jgi:hypothetical protein